MTAPIFTAQEIQHLLAIEKQTPYENWNVGIKPKRQGNDNNIRRKVVKAMSPQEPELEFEIERVQRRKGYSIEHTIALYARLSPRPLVPICHYDIQDNPHTNPRCCSNPIRIEHRQAHRHIYCSRCVEEIGNWAACAELLPLECGSEPKMVSQFLLDLRVKFQSSGAHQSLFEDMQW